MNFGAVLWILISVVLNWGALAYLAQPETLWVCADQDYLPYSNRSGQGFENQIAEAVARAIGARLAYSWALTRRHGGFSEFLSSTLDARKCDVVVNFPYRLIAPYPTRGSEKSWLGFSHQKL